MLNTKLGFIGGGNIAMAIIKGLLTRGVDPQQITVADPSPDQSARFEPLKVVITDNNLEATKNADAVILSVKPDMVSRVSLEIAESLSDDSLIISVAAGITLQSLQSWMGQQQAIIRCMPNTPALIQAGATGVYANANVSENQRSLTSDLLSAIGVVQWMQTESQIDAVTAVSGSGPAYFFLIMEVMQSVAVELGLPEEVAEQLVVQTAAGAAGMVKQTGESPAELRHKVTSPGGTTAAAITSFEHDGLADTIRRAMNAAMTRSIELSKQ